MLKKELGIFSFGDLLELYPHRHIDKTKVSRISDISPQTEFIQVAGTLLGYDLVGAGRAKRLVAQIRDQSGVLELAWFQGINWVMKNMQVGSQYLVFGKTGFFNGRPQIVHPEWEIFVPASADGKAFLEPVYPSTEKLKARGFNGRQMGKLTQSLFTQLQPADIVENIPHHLISQMQLLSRYEAFKNIHFPANTELYEKAVKRLKFEEFFIAQIRLQLVRLQRHHSSKGEVFEKVGENFNRFYNEYLPFQLTGAQKRVLKEIRQDTGRGHQMNRL